jgi:ATP-dependent DNA helicase RecQ
LSIHDILYKYWGYQNFRPLQEDIIQSILDGNDTLALLPTGGGKSICFQVPAMLNPGMCLVVSPLIALIKDQVENLHKKDITAGMLYSGMPFKQVDNVLKNAINSKYKFLYVSPERLETSLFLEYLPAMDINLIAIDEAHCISQWGYDFRPPYLRIAAIREQLHDVPVLALTASATVIVQKDICEKLALKKQQIFQKSFSRPNLSYSAIIVDSKINKTVDILNKIKGTAIVYCKSRKRTKEVADLLMSYNINATHYNAGLTPDERNQKQQDWIEDKVRVIVCTNAFGMGIDKPNVRVVIHYDATDCLENYYQEAGRAGRDEQKAYAVLLYNDLDIEALKNSVAIKYPSVLAIKEVYFSICNYLQIEANSYENNYIDFDINAFAKQFKYDVLLVLNSLKILEQEDIIRYSESVLMPPTIEIIANRNKLNAIENNNPPLDIIVKTLLRTYSGIMGNVTKINEKNIAFIAKKELKLVTAQLHQLHNLGIIKYTPASDEPQLYFVQERLHSNSFSINEPQYMLRKKEYEKRVVAFIDFITNITNCRSTTISNYFGVNDITNCGVCNNCLNNYKKDVPLLDLETMMQKIVSFVAQKQQVTLQQIQQWPKQTETQKAIALLLNEGKLIRENDIIKVPN